MTMNYLGMVYAPSQNGAAMATPAQQNISGPQSIGLQTSISGSTAGVQGSLALLVLLGAVTAFYIITRSKQGGR